MTWLRLALKTAFLKKPGALTPEEFRKIIEDAHHEGCQTSCAVCHKLTEMLPGIETSPPNPSTGRGYSAWAPKGDEIFLCFRGLLLWPTPLDAVTTKRSVSASARSPVGPRCKSCTKLAGQAFGPRGRGPLFTARVLKRGEVRVPRKLPFMAPPMVSDPVGIPHKSPNRSQKIATFAARARN